MPAAPRNLLTQWSRLFVESLADAGLRRVVISPGSRSTPLVAAVLECSRLSHHVVIDERCAGFFALGQAKLSGEPTALLCTSGSALAHYLPALIEADECRVPLLVLSADRPSELQHSRSPQTIDQTALFGSKVRAFVDLGAPGASDLSLRSLRRKAVQVLATSRGPLAGPVHVNFPAAKPLEPVVAVTEAEHDLQRRVDALLGVVLDAPPNAARDASSAVSSTAASAATGPVHLAGVTGLSPQAVEAIAEALHGAQRPVIAVGPLPVCDGVAAEAIGRLARRTGWPLLCESTSQLRFGAAGDGALGFDAFDWVLRAALGGAAARPMPLSPDAVLHFGEPLTSGAWAKYVELSADLSLVVAHPSAWADPSQRARLVVNAPLAEVARSLEARLAPASAAWRQRVEQLDALAWQCVRERVSSDSNGFDEAQALDVVGKHLCDGDLLCLGNSLPVRLADVVLSRSSVRVRCLSQRGANGIDGLISSAAGAATLHDGHTLAVIGDVSALHDVGGMVVAASVDRPLTVLVLDNQGGRIFEQLPIDAWAAERDGRLMTDGAATPNNQSSNDSGCVAPQANTLDAWVTPHRLQAWRFADAAGLRAFRVQTPSELDAALKLARDHARPCVIDAQLLPSGAKAFYAAVTRRLQERWAAFDGES